MKLELLPSSPPHLPTSPQNDNNYSAEDKQKKYNWSYLGIMTRGVTAVLRVGKMSLAYVFMEG